MTAQPLEVAEPHVHDWRLRAVGFDDGVSTEEFGCDGCDAVTFR